VNRRLLLAGVLAALLGGGLVGTASASSPASVDTTRHKVCIDHQVLLPDGFCVVWDDPLNK
jgi:hypothetical protein